MHIQSLALYTPTSQYGLGSVLEPVQFKATFSPLGEIERICRIAGRALEPNSCSNLPNTMLHVVGTGDEVKGGLVAGNDTNRG